MTVTAAEDIGTLFKTQRKTLYVFSNELKPVFNPQDFRCGPDCLTAS